jgi:hypothetical protein
MIRRMKGQTEGLQPWGINSPVELKGILKYLKRKNYTFDSTYVISIDPYAKIDQIQSFFIC